MSLFGSTTVTNTTSRRVLLTLRAGICNLENGTVTPDPRGGVLTVSQESSGLVELRWEPTANKGAPVVVPVVVGEAKVQRVAKVTTGRVFVVNCGARQVFFWLQDSPDAERDAQYFKQLQRAVEGKGTVRVNTDAAAPVPVSAPASGAAAAPALARGAIAAAANSAPQMDVSDFTRLLESMGAAAPSAAGGSHNPTTARVRITDVMRAPGMRAALLADSAFYMTRLHDTLPSGVDASDDIVDQVINPQVGAAASALDAALQDPVGYNEIATAFGIRLLPGAAPTVAALLEAIAAEPLEGAANPAPSQPSADRSGDAAQ